MLELRLLYVHFVRKKVTILQNVGNQCQKSEYYNVENVSPTTKVHKSVFSSRVDKSNETVSKSQEVKLNVVIKPEDPEHSRPVSAISVNNVPRDDNPFASYTFKGRVSLERGGPTFQIQWLRDTAGAQSILVEKVLPNVESKFTGEYVIVDGIGGDSRSLPLAEIYHETGLIAGPVVVAVEREPLPVNDLASNLIVPCPIVTCNPTAADVSKFEENASEGFAICAVTRCQGQDVLGGLFNEEELPITRENLIKAQKDDKILHKCFEIVEDVVSRGTGFYVKDSVFMRQYRPRDVAVDDHWAVV